MVSSEWYNPQEDYSALKNRSKTYNIFVYRVSFWRKLILKLLEAHAQFTQFRMNEITHSIQ